MTDNKEQDKEIEIDDTDTEEVEDIIEVKTDNITIDEIIEEADKKTTKEFIEDAV